MAGGFSHILVSRQGQGSSWDQATVFDQAFLRRNTVLVGGDARGYLYRLVPPEQRGEVAWTVGDNLIRTFDGQAAAANITAEQERDVRLVGDIAGDGRYLFTFSSQSMSAIEGSMTLRVDWLDDKGAVIGSVAERGRASMHTSHEDIMLMPSPPGAKTAIVTIHVGRGVVELSGLSIKKMADGAARGDSLADVAR
jgi:hypothetical protein